MILRLRPDTLAMTAVFGLLTALGPLSTDMYLPSLPAIGRALGASDAQVQQTLSAYLFGFAAGQVFYGPVSDRVGRKPAILVGLALYMLASAACALATSIEWLTLMRFVQALGAAGPIVLGRAMVRDLYEGPRAGRELSPMGTIMGLVPALAPVVGGLLETAFGWRSNFWSVVVLTGVLAAVVIVALPETLTRKRPEPLSIAGIFGGFGTLLRNPAYRAYVGLSSLTYTGLFAFISGSSFVLQRVYGLSPLLFGVSFGITVLGFIAGTLLAPLLVGRRGLDGTIGIGVGFLVAGSLTMLALMALGTGSWLEVTLPMALYTCGVGLVMPQSNAAAMTPFPDRAGSASSLLGLLQMSLAAVVGALMGVVLPYDPRILPMTILVMGLVALVLFRASRSARRGQA